VSASPLSAGGWRAFRLWLNELADELLVEILTDYEMEASARIERDQRIDRLFFSSLADADLAIARDLIDSEITARQAISAQRS
jgi:hypothetical protein